MTCTQCDQEAVSEVMCSEGSACLCARCAADFWAFHVTGEGFERDELSGIGL